MERAMENARGGRSEGGEKAQKPLFFPRVESDSFTDHGGVLGGAGGEKRHGVPPSVHLLGLATEGASLGEPRLASGGLAQHGRACAAEHHAGRMAEHGGDMEAAGTLEQGKATRETPCEPSPLVPLNESALAAAASSRA